MRWFRTHGKQSSFPVSGTFYTVCTRPYYYNNILYGTESNPYYKVSISRPIIGSGYSHAYPIDSNYYENLSNGYLIGSPNDEDFELIDDDLAEVKNKKILGRYEFGISITGLDLGVQYAFPIEFDLIKTNGDRLHFNYIQPSNYSGNHIGLIFGNAIDNTTLFLGKYVVPFEEQTELPKDLQNCQIDFGDIPQNIPEPFFNWFSVNCNVEYGGSITIKDRFGFEILASLSNLPPISETNLSYNGTNRTLVLTDVIGQTHTIYWTNSSPRGRSFAGLSYYVNNNEPNIPVGISTDVSITGSVDLYESYFIRPEDVTTFDIILYKNRAENNRVDKTNYLERVGTLSGVLRNSSSVNNLAVTFEYDTFPRFNYVYIVPFDRYYYVNDITAINYGLWEMSLSVDVLMTYKEAILSCTGFIDRNEQERNPNIVDDKIVAEMGCDISVQNVENDLFTVTQGEYTLSGLLIQGGSF